VFDDNSKIPSVSAPDEDLLVASTDEVEEKIRKCSTEKKKKGDPKRAVSEVNILM